MKGLKEIRRFLKDWPEKKIFEGESFNEIFQLDGIPLWYFVHYLFYPPIIPKHISPYPLKGESLAFPKKAKMNLLSHAMRHALLLREKKKISDLKGQRKSRNDVLFLSYTNHILGKKGVFRIQYVLDELHKKEISASPLFVDSLSTTTHLDLKGRSTIYPYFSESIYHLAIKDASLFSRRFKDLEGKDDMLLFKDKKVWDEMSPAFHFFFSKEMLTITFLYFRMFRACILEQKAKVFGVTGAESLFERCAIAACHAEGVPAVIIQHGFESDTHFVGELDYLTKYFAMSEYERKSLKKNGFPSSFIEVTGPIIYDEMACCLKRKPGRTDRILLAGSAAIESNYLSKDEYFRNVRNIAKAAQSLGLRLDVKPHPREKHIDGYEAIRKELNYKHMKVHKSTSREQFYKMMVTTDAFIQFGSTSALEAMILGAPILTIRVVDYPDNIMLDVCDAAIKIDKDDDIRKAIQETIMDSTEMKGKREKFINYYIGNVDGNASKRAADLLQKMIR
jgi:hypothetical protein